MTSETKSRKARVVRSEWIADQLEADIVDGALASGSKLDETAIAERFSVSRTPVREAFMTLVSRSLAERVPYRGVIVRDLSVDRIEQMFEAMAEIEGLCGRVAAGSMSLSERKALRDRHRAMQALADAKDLTAFGQLNSALHEQISLGTHNSDLIEIADGLRLKLAPFRRSQLLNRERVMQSNAEHEDIVHAIIERDAVTAERLLRLHLMSSADSYLTALRSRMADHTEARSGSLPRAPAEDHVSPRRENA